MIVIGGGMVLVLGFLRFGRRGPIARDRLQRLLVLPDGVETGQRDEQHLVVGCLRGLEDADDRPLGLMLGSGG